MKKMFYPRLALTGMKKSKKIYIPYILTCTGMNAMFYIITALCSDKMLETIPHSDTVATVLGLGSWMTGIFSLIFLFYTNSFLVRRRNTEFGLYNILGLSKRNICRVVLCETLITAVISAVAGALLGILLSKAAQLALLNMMRGEIQYGFSVSVSALLKEFAVFGVIHLIIFFNSIAKIKATNTADLLHSESFGEKPPHGNIFIGILGVLLLAVSYTLAVTVKQPISALVLFFFAVIMVIIGTYMVFISGSVVFCRLLKKNKNYYYKPQHFISVSSMTYRMKRNGAGLASICILATMVLVMLTGSGCLFFGSEDALKARYPRDVVITGDFENSAQMQANIPIFDGTVKKTAQDHGIKEKDLFTYSYANIAGVVSKNGTFEPDPNAFGTTVIPSDFMQLYFISLDDYNKMYEKNETLGENEALIFTVHSVCDFKNLTHKNGLDLKIKGSVPDLYLDGSISADITPAAGLIVPDLEKTLAPLQSLFDSEGDKMLKYSWIYAFNSSASPEKTQAAADEISAALESAKSYPQIKILTETLEENRQDFYATFGSLFFLGLMLSAVFILAAVLIIYYKQISEGYEDRERFEIMQKVGMTKRDIKKSVNSQLLTVFFMPLIFAVMHLCFAFPIIRRLLMLFHLTNIPLLIGTAALCVGVFAVFYAAVYKITSKIYYNIVK